MFEFKTKARTLLSLVNKLNYSKVLPVYIINVDSYRLNKESYIKEIRDFFTDQKVIVRSSSFSEDSYEYSLAGYYKSKLNVSLHCDSELIDAIEYVTSSYGQIHSNDEVFIQPMLTNISTSGVAFTADLDTLSNYYIINYDISGKTDTVTSGEKGSYQTFVQAKDEAYENNDNNFIKLFNAFKELEFIFNNDKLDIEFALTNSKEVIIFQVRPIVQKSKVNLSNLPLNEVLNKINRKVQKLNQKHPNLLGDKTVFGVMPDWNPAEIIGLKPKKLALSLYKELITDSIWAYQRDNYGYRNLRSHPLLISFLGVPFVDVRVDFNSFIPKILNEEIAEKLVNYYIDKLIKIPSYHDKVEFEIVHSCYHFTIQNKLNELLDNNFTKDEISQIKFSLLQLTNEIIKTNGFCDKDLNKIELLKVKFSEVYSSNLSTIDKIYWLIEDVKRYGTLPFAGIARAAFVATQMMKSLVEKGVITKEDYHLYLNSLNTVAKDIQFDLVELKDTKITKTEFLNKWGHLRPGTYDILSKRYDDAFDLYFTNLPGEKLQKSTFSFSSLQLKTIEEELKSSDIKITVNEFLEFVKKSIEGREYAKFVFTKSLSEVLKLIEGLGNKHNISAEDLAHLDINIVLSLYSELTPYSVAEIFDTNIETNKKQYEYTKAVKLPSLITKPEDVCGFFLLAEEPNFITLKSITAQIISEEEINTNDIAGKIVMIKSADPGYDFLFTKNIAGLITQFGGANSHMAVRCAELSLPAIIGAGENNFNKWKKAIVVELDCANKNINIIR